MLHIIFPKYISELWPFYLSQKLVSAQYLEKNRHNFTKFYICIHIDKTVHGTVACHVIFIRSLGLCPGGRLGGYRGGLSGPKNFFLEIQPDLAFELLTSMAHAMAQFFGSLPPGALGRGQKVKYH